MLVVIRLNPKPDDRLVMLLSERQPRDESTSKTKIQLLRMFTVDASLKSRAFTVDLSATPVLTDAA